MPKPYAKAIPHTDCMVLCGFSSSSLLLSVAACLSLGQCARASAATSPHVHLPGNSPLKDVATLSAAAATEQLCSRQITAEEYAVALLQAGQKWQCVNAFSELQAERVLRDARAVDDRAAAGEDIRPLCGLTVAVKELFDVAGYTAGAGTPALQGHRPNDTSAVIKRFQEASGVVLGMTRSHEMALGCSTISPAFGPVLNPYDQQRHVGGSSGGSAALVSARAAPAAFCTDTAGSCRVPGALTGVAGFRPSWGCWNPGTDQVVPLIDYRDTPGIIARSAADVTLLNQVMSSCGTAAPEVQLQGLRIGYPRNWWKPTADEMKTTYEGALAALRKAGAILVDVDVGHVEAYKEEHVPGIFSITSNWGRGVSQYLWRHQLPLSFYSLVQRMTSPLVQGLGQSVLRGEGTPSVQETLDILSIHRPRLKEMYKEVYERHDLAVMITPTTAVPAPLISSSEPYTLYRGQYVDSVSTLLWTADMEPEVGAPAISISAGLTTELPDTGTHLPVGLQLQARPGDDALLLAVASAVEAILPDTPPPPDPECAGCTAEVQTQEVTYSGSGPLQPGQTTSAYTLELGGSCELKHKLLPEPRTTSDIVQS